MTGSQDSLSSLALISSGHGNISFLQCFLYLKLHNIMECSSKVSSSVLCICVLPLHLHSMTLWAKFFSQQSKCKTERDLQRGCNERRLVCYAISSCIRITGRSVHPTPSSALPLTSLTQPASSWRNLKQRRPRERIREVTKLFLHVLLIWLLDTAQPQGAQFTRPTTACTFITTVVRCSFTSHSNKSVHYDKLRANRRKVPWVRSSLCSCIQTAKAPLLFNNGKNSKQQILLRELSYVCFISHGF